VLMAYRQLLGNVNYSIYVTEPAKIGDMGTQNFKTLSTYSRLCLKNTDKIIAEFVHNFLAFCRMKILYSSAEL